MSRRWFALLGAALVSLGVGALGIAHPARDASESRAAPAETVRLPAPRSDSDTSIERALSGRRSIRDYRDAPLTLAEVSQLMWAAQGVTDARAGFRTAPSAGATYPLELYVVVGNVEGLRAGVYRYLPHRHEIARTRDGDIRGALASAALNQSSVERGAAVLVFAAVYERTTRRYGERGVRYVHMEAGHASQNVYLQAVALRLGTVVIGAFDDDRVQRTLLLPSGEHALYLMPVGRP